MSDLVVVITIREFAYSYFFRTSWTQSVRSIENKANTRCVTSVLRYYTAELPCPFSTYQDGVNLESKQTSPSTSNIAFEWGRGQINPCVLSYPSDRKRPRTFFTILLSQSLRLSSKASFKIVLETFF